MSQATRPALREAPYGYTVSLVNGLPDALAGFTSALWNPAGAASERVKELVFLRTSIVNRCHT